jgi:hypothetical protein
MLYSHLLCSLANKGDAPTIMCSQFYAAIATIFVPSIHWFAAIVAEFGPRSPFILDPCMRRTVTVIRRPVSNNIPNTDHTYDDASKNNSNYRPVNAGTRGRSNR